MPSFGHFETVFKNLAELKNSFLVMTTRSTGHLVNCFEPLVK